MTQNNEHIIKYIPLQQGLRLLDVVIEEDHIQDY